MFPMHMHHDNLEVIMEPEKPYTRSPALPELIRDLPIQQSAGPALVAQQEELRNDLANKFLERMLDYNRGEFEGQAPTLRYIPKRLLAQWALRFATHVANYYITGLQRGIDIGRQIEAAERRGEKLQLVVEGDEPCDEVIRQGVGITEDTKPVPNRLPRQLSRSKCPQLAADSKARGKSHHGRIGSKAMVARG